MAITATTLTTKSSKLGQSALFVITLLIMVMSSSTVFAQGQAGLDLGGWSKPAKKAAAAKKDKADSDEATGFDDRIKLSLYCGATSAVSEDTTGGQSGLDANLSLGTLIYSFSGKRAGAESYGWITAFASRFVRSRRGHDIGGAGNYVGVAIGQEWLIIQSTPSEEAESQYTLSFYAGIRLEGVYGVWKDPDWREENGRAAAKVSFTLFDSYGDGSAPNFLLNINLGLGTKRTRGSTTSYVKVYQQDLLAEFELNLEIYTFYVQLGQSREYATPWGDVTTRDGLFKRFWGNVNFQWGISSKHNDTELRANRPSRPANADYGRTEVGLTLVSFHLNPWGHVLEVNVGGGYTAALSVRQEGFLVGTPHERKLKHHSWSQGVFGRIGARLSGRLEFDLRAGVSKDSVLAGKMIFGYLGVTYSW